VLSAAVIGILLAMGGSPARADAIRFTWFADGINPVDGPGKIARGPGGEMVFRAPDGLGEISLDGSVRHIDPGLTVGNSDSGVPALGPGGSLWFGGVAGYAVLGRNGALTQTALAGGVSGWAPAAGGAMWTLLIAVSAVDLLRVDRDGAISAFPTPLPVPSYPVGVAVDGKGDVWFAAYGAPSEGWIGWRTPAGAVHVRGLAREPGGIAAIADGAWFTEPGEVSHISASGESERFGDGGPPGVPAGTVAVTTDRDVWFTDPGRAAVGRVTPAGTITQYRVPGLTQTRGGPDSIAAGPADTLWLTDSASARIGRIALGRTRCSVPEVVGMSVARARRALGDSGCRARVSAAAHAGYVLWQDPPAGALRMPASDVRLRSGGQAAARAASRCLPHTDRRVLLSDGSAAVMARSKYPSDTGPQEVDYTVCTAQRTVALDDASNTPDALFTADGPFALAGPYVAWARVGGFAGAGASAAITYLNWQAPNQPRPPDLAVDGPNPQDTYGVPSDYAITLLDLKLSPTGALAWRSERQTDVFAPLTMEIHTTTHAGSALLDSGPAGIIGPLTLTGSTLHWTHNGAPRSAELGP
jgi:virginiamycin B lyase